MKKELLVAFAAFFFMSICAITGAYAVEEQNHMTIISKHQIDVTGDKEIDTVFIKGKFYEDGLYLKEIYGEIIASTGKMFKIDLQSGYDPTVQFIDLNHDGVKDLFFSIPTGGSGGISNHFLYTAKDCILTDLTIPPPLQIEGHFLDHYKAKIFINNMSQSYKLDLTSRVKEYEELGLYTKGKLNEDKKLMVHPITYYTPIQLKDGQSGLKGVQRISGVFNADSLATIESYWVYKKNNWRLLNATLKRINNHHPRKT